MQHMVEQCMSMMPMSTMMWPMMISQILILALLIVGFVFLLRSFMRRTPHSPLSS